jgi:hypothetical protein
MYLPYFNSGRNFLISEFGIIHILREASGNRAGQAVGKNDFLELLLIDELLPALNFLDLLLINLPHLFSPGQYIFFRGARGDDFVSTRGDSPETGTVPSVLGADSQVY